tara:strand:- start:1838 stop:2029 length:192 start_codon:yes stop_codon:yes gene_type:complete
MVTLKFNNCGMVINANYAKLCQALVDDILRLDNGVEVRISRCPECEGKIKSPSCCGIDMVCKN